MNNIATAVPGITMPHSKLSPQPLIPIVLMLTFLIMLTQTSRAQLIWDGDASKGTGVFKLIGSNCGSPGSVTVVNDAERGQVFRYHKPSSSDRCENHGITVGGSGYVFKKNTTYHIGWFTKLSNTVNNNAIFQWKVYPSPGPDGLNWPIAIKMINGRLTMINRKADGEVYTVWSAPFTANRWYHIALTLRLSDVRDGGYVELYFNGVKQNLSNGTQRWACQLFDVDHVCPKWGVYGASGSNVINYIDNLKIGSSYNDVKMPAGSASMLAETQGDPASHDNTNLALDPDNTIILSATGSDVKLETHPNPTQGPATLTFQLQEEGRVKILLYNTVEQKPVTLMDEDLAAGTHRLPLDASQLHNGLYIIHLLHHEKVTIYKLLKE
jgi:hypothetical protein